MFKETITLSPIALLVSASTRRPSRRTLAGERQRYAVAKRCCDFERALLDSGRCRGVGSRGRSARRVQLPRNTKGAGPPSRVRAPDGTITNRMVDVGSLAEGWRARVSRSRWNGRWLDWLHDHPIESA